ncbi:hypothetical protein ACFYZ4_11095 [Streptomyces sp. NPDC001513]|uniref:hypothetical protein n=1 Tax=Streptomyces sp. NPDC001513 TaxID=3364580 RepID=UPI00368EEC02
MTTVHVEALAHRAVRKYVMSKVAYVSGARATELCLVRLGDLFWDQGQWGRFLVQGNGARGSGPRERMAFMFAEGRELLWWYVEEVRGLFPDVAEIVEARAQGDVDDAHGAATLLLASIELLDRYESALKTHGTRHEAEGALHTAPPPLTRTARSP